jgi:endonuclease IV
MHRGAVGIHVGKGKFHHYHEAVRYELDHAREMGIVSQSFQIFAVGPRKDHVNIDEEDSRKLKEIINEGNRCFIHSSYLTRLWGKTRGKGRMLLSIEMKISDAIGAEGVIIHLADVLPESIAMGLRDFFMYFIEGSVAPMKEMYEETPNISLSDLYPNLPEIMPKTKVYIEVDSHKASDVTYETPQKLHNLFQQLEYYISRDWTRYIGVCIDTAHLFAAGVNITTRESMQRWIDEFINSGITPRVTIALNDQKYELGSGRDAHAPLAYGTIWRSKRTNLDESGIKAMLEWATKDDIVIILERGHDKPKIDGLPIISNIDSDYDIITSMGYFRV